MEEGSDGESGTSGAAKTQGIQSSGLELPLDPTEVLRGRSSPAAVLLHNRDDGGLFPKWAIGVLGILRRLAYSRST